MLCRVWEQGPAEEEHESWHWECTHSTDGSEWWLVYGASRLSESTSTCAVAPDLFEALVVLITDAEQY